MNQALRDKIDQANDSAMEDSKINFNEDLVISTVFDFTTYDLDYNEVTTIFATNQVKELPLVRISYNDSDEDNIVDDTGISIWDLRIFHLDETSNEWTRFEDEWFVFMEENNTAFKPSHFSVYCVMALETREIEKVANYPNPFSEDTTFIFNLDFLSSDLQIEIFTISGRLIRLITNDEINPVLDYNEVYWDGKDDAGNSIANGIYVYKITATANDNKIERTGKLVKVK